MDSIKEAVIFLFIQNDKVLVEFRQTAGEDEVLVPGGGIEEFDQHITEDNRERAMMREISEEFGKQISVVTYQYITTEHHDITKDRFYIYFVTKWNGDLPEYSMEDGKPYAKLVWLSPDDALLLTKSNIARTILQKAKEYIEK